VFSNCYQRSDKFAGTRRSPENPPKKKDKQASVFHTVQPRANSAPDQPIGKEFGEQVTVYIGHQVRLHCSDYDGIDAIM